MFQPLGLGTLIQTPSRSSSRLNPPTTDCQVPVPSQRGGDVPAKSVEIGSRAFKGLRFASVVSNSPSGTRRRLTQGSGFLGSSPDRSLSSEVASCLSDDEAKSQWPSPVSSNT